MATASSMRCTPMRRIPMRCTLMRRKLCEIHACEKHIHKGVGVHLIGVCLRDSDFSIWVFGKGSLTPAPAAEPFTLVHINAAVKGIIKQLSLAFETCSICHVRMIYEKGPAAGGWVGRRLSKIVDYEDRRSGDCSSLTTASCPFAAARDSGVRPSVSFESASTSSR